MMSKMVLVAAALLALAVVAQRPKPGTLKWKVPVTSGQVVGNPEADFATPGNVYVPTTNSVLAFDNMGKNIWTFAAPSGQSVTSVASFTVVVIGGLTEVYAVERFTGKALWTFALPSSPRPNPSSGAIVTSFEGTVFVTTNNGPLIAIDELTGKQLYTAGTGLAYNHAQSDGAQVFFSTLAGGKNFAVAADAKTGVVAWNISNSKDLMISRRDRLIYAMAVEGGDTIIWVNNITNGGTYLFNYTLPNVQGVNWWVDFEGNAMYVSYKGITAFEGRSSKQIWQDSNVTAGFIMPTLAACINYGKGYVEALDGRNGKIWWTMNGPQAVNVGTFVPDFLHGDSIVFGTETEIIAINV